MEHVVTSRVLVFTGFLENITLDIVVDFILVVEKKLQEVDLLGIDTGMDQSGVSIALNKRGNSEALDEESDKRSHEIINVGAFDCTSHRNSPVSQTYKRTLLLVEV